MPDLRTTTADGWRLGLVRTPAPGQPRGVLLLLHAMMVDHRCLDRPAGAGLASALAARGYEVWRADFRGRGMSGPPPKEGGRWRYDDLVRHDLPALVGAVRAVSPGLPLAIVGHSLGGHVSAASLGMGLVEADALVGLAINIWQPRLEPSLRKRWRKRLGSWFFGGLGGVLGRVPARRLRIGPCDEAGPYAMDLLRFWRQDRWTSADGRDDYDAALAQLGCPALMVVGTGDDVYATPAAARAWAAQIGPDPAAFWLVGEGAFGVEGHPGHMDIAVDPVAAPLWSRIADWLDEALPTRP